MNEPYVPKRAWEEPRVRRMRAQLLTVLGCVAGMVTTYLIAAALIQQRN